jgi:hypothetical protein
MTRLLLASSLLFLPWLAAAQKAHPALSQEAMTAKELFLCSCINAGFPKDSLLSKDTSGQLIMERALENGQHSYAYMGKVSSLGKQIARSFPVTPFGTRSVFIGCLRYYKSKALEQKLKEFTD